MKQTIKAMGSFPIPFLGPLDRCTENVQTDGRRDEIGCFFFCCVVAVVVVVVVVVVLVIRYGTAKEESDRNTATSGNGPSRRRNGSRPAASL